MVSPSDPDPSPPEAHRPPAVLPDQDDWRRLSPLLDEALDLPPEARAAWLAAIGADDPSIAAQLRRLLDEDDAARARGFLDGRAPSSTEATELSGGLAGVTVGAYTLEAPLGQGGSGSVWRARRSDGQVDAVAAVKLLHLSLLGHSAAGRFRREGAILARLTHPNIARLMDAGVTPAGQPYLVLELVEGRPIDEQCDALGLDIDARLQLFLDVLGAVAHAHRHLVVHRDIKPQNVLLTTDRQVKLLDFGIAKLVDDDTPHAEATALTREAGRVLTPAYAAPEQFGGAPISTATDIYALGVLLYRLLVGRHPTARAGAGTDEMIHAVIHTEPLRPSRAAARPLDPHTTLTDVDARARQRASTPERLGRRLHGDLDNILDRMLRKAPAERYQSVDAVAADLRRHLAHLPVSARPDVWHYRLAKFVRRHRVAVAATAVLVLTLAGGVVGTLTQAERARRLGELAQRERDHALSELAAAEAANEFIGNVLTEGSRQPMSSGALLDQAASLLDRQFAEAPPLKARMQVMLGTMYGEMLENAKAIEILDRAAELARVEPGALGAAARGQVDCLRAALRQDLPALEQALAGLPSLVPTSPQAAADIGGLADEVQSHAVCLTRRSVLLRRQGRLADAQADARAALDLLGAPRPGRELAWIHAQRELASAIGNQGANAQAVQAWRDLLAMLEARGRQRSVYAANAHNNLATRLGNAGQELAALAAQQEAVSIWRELQGDAALHPLLWANLAMAFDGVGRRGEADEAYRQALARIDASTPADVRQGATRLGATLACRAGRLSECERLVRALEELQRPDLPPGHLDRAALWRARASLAELRGDTEAERAALGETLRIARASPVRNTLLPHAAVRLAWVEHLGGDPVAARAAAQLAESAAADLSRGFDHSSLVGEALLVRGAIEAAGGDTAQALRALQAAQAHLVATGGSASPGALEAARAMAALERQTRVARRHD